MGLIHFNGTEKCDFMPRNGILLMMTMSIKRDVRESDNSKRNYERQRIVAV